MMVFAVDKIQKQDLAASSQPCNIFCCNLLASALHFNREYKSDSCVNSAGKISSRQFSGWNDSGKLVYPHQQPEFFKL